MSPQDSKDPRSCAVWWCVDEGGGGGGGDVEAGHRDWCGRAGEEDEVIQDQEQSSHVMNHHPPLVPVPIGSQSQRSQLIEG